MTRFEQAESGSVGTGLFIICGVKSSFITESEILLRQLEVSSSSKMVTVETASTVCVAFGVLFTECLHRLQSSDQGTCSPQLVRYTGTPKYNPC